MLNKLLIAWCSFLALFFSCPLMAQGFRVGVQGQIAIGKLGEMEQVLSQATAQQKADLLVRLGVEPKIADTIAEELRPDEKIELRSVRVLQQMHYGVAFLPGFRGCFLYLLQGSDDEVQKHPWHVIDRQSIDCWHGDSVLEFLPLRSADTDDIVAHHVNYGHGSNYVEDQTQIFSILNGKLVQTMATQDFLSQGTLGTEEEITTECKSTFLPFPDFLLEESRTTAVNSFLKKVERRYWRWSEERKKFLASDFVSVVAPNH